MSSHMPVDFFDSLNFRFAWRSYQKRVLEDLETHLADQKLHIVAPPGSGKTILGLEVVRRLAARTLILSPTTVIRDQWIARLKLFGADDAAIYSECSTDLHHMKMVTSSTYQGMYVACKNDALRIDGIQTLVLDEAHHLKHEWWRALTRLIKDHDKIKLISLTATPPFDSTGAEWNRYEALCGPIDAEIFVSELVGTGTLVPHQDYFYCCELTAGEKQHFQALENAFHDVMYDLIQDHNLFDWIACHPWITHPVIHIEDIQKRVLAFFSMIVVGKQVGVNTYQVLKVFDWMTCREIPECNPLWLERFLEFFLKSPNGQFKNEDFVEVTRRKLKRIGVLRGHKVSFEDNHAITKIFKESAAKLEGVGDLLTFEYELLGSALRMVVLTDRIRKEFLNDEGIGEQTQQLGVVPIFQSLIALPLAEICMTVLTGSLIIVHASIVERTAVLADEQSLDYTLSVHLDHASYFNLKFKSNQLAKWVGIFTQLFDEGLFQVLIGTCSLLGEGWDCPCANTLIMATDMGSYATTNQIRGRVLRLHGKDPRKAAHIWHLCSRIHYEHLEKPGIKLMGDHKDTEYEKMVHRFDQFEGVSLAEPIHIRTGIVRLHHDTSLSNQALNHYFTGFAQYRSHLKMMWEQAIAGQDEREPVKKKIRIVSVNTKGLVHADLLDALYGCAVNRSILSFGGFGVSACLLFSVIPLGVVFAGASLVPLYAAVRAWQQHRNFSDNKRYLQKTSKVLVAALRTNGMIDGQFFNKASIKYDTKNQELLLDDLSFADRNIVYFHLRQILQPAVDARYLLEHNFGDAKLYQSLPESFSRKKSLAQCYHACWQKEFGQCELVYLRRREHQQQRLEASLQWLQQGEHIKLSEAWV